MGKKRKNPADNWMPPRVYRGKSAYEYRSTDNRTYRLCKLDAEKDEVLEAYLEVKLKTQQKNTLARLINEYLLSPQFKDKGRRTQQDYEACSVNIARAFGKLHPDNIKTHHIREYMDKRGAKSKVRANRELSFFTGLMGWAYERNKVRQNPCIGIKRFTEKARDRYVDDEEYDFVYEYASPNVKVAMEIAYLCAARQRDILDLKTSDILEEGLYIEQGKTGKKQIKAWTPRLRQAIELALSQPSRLKTDVLIHNQHGQAYTSSGFKANFKRTMDYAMGHCHKRKDETDEHYQKRLRVFKEKYPGKLKERFTFHDLKAKGISDYQGDKQRFSGHKTRSQMEKYNRKVEVVSIVDPENDSKV